MLWNDIWEENSFSQHSANLCRWKTPLLVVPAKSLHCVSTHLQRKISASFWFSPRQPALLGYKIWEWICGCWLGYNWLFIFFWLATCLSLVLIGKILFSGHLALEFNCTFMWSILKNNFKLKIKVVYFKENRI